MFFCAVVQLGGIAGRKCSFVARTIQGLDMHQFHKHCKQHKFPQHLQAHFLRFDRAKCVKGLVHAGVHVLSLCCDIEFDDYDQFRPHI